MSHGLSLTSFRRLSQLAVVLVAGVLIVGCGPNGPKSAGAVVHPPSEKSVRNRQAAMPNETNSPYRHEEALPPYSNVVIRDVRDWDLPETAARSLGRIGSAAVPELTKQLTDRDPEVRERAANVLARIGPSAKQAVPDLVAALEDDDQAVRKSAALALGQIGPAAADAVPALMRVMKESVAEAPVDGKPKR